MKILVLGAGVIGTVYAAKLLQAGHTVVIFARGDRLAELTGHGLVLEEAETHARSEQPVRVVGVLNPAERFDVVLVPVRSGQLRSTLPILSAMPDDCDVVFFGNAAGQEEALVKALGSRVVLGFPAVAGVRRGPVVRYVLIPQQQTMLGEPGGAQTPRVRVLQAMFQEAGFPTTVTSDMRGWLLGHAAFVVPIAYALYATRTDAAALAADRDTLRMMVRATRQAFGALRSSGTAQIPANLTWLYLRLPEAFAVAYWRRVMAGPRGELWFAAHSRAAPEEMQALAETINSAVRQTGRPTPDLDRLLAR